MPTSEPRQLLRTISSPALYNLDLADRRRVTVKRLGDLLAADAGHWAWGRGNPLDATIAPVAMIDFGYSAEQRIAMIEHHLHPDVMATFQSRVAHLMAGASHVGVCRRDALSDDDWRRSALWQAYVQRSGLGSWVHAVNYSTPDTWSCLHFCRSCGREEYTAEDALLVDQALDGVIWLNSGAEERVSPAQMASLTSRQRTVMLLLLDGLPRKQIAEQLAITEHTVDDHLKSIYTLLGVRSVAELAALFLRSQ